MVKDVADWASSRDDVWDQSNTPADTLRFVNLVRNNQPAFLRSKGVKESLRVMLDQIRERANVDAERADDVAYEDQLAGRAEACSQLERTFSQFGLLQEAGAAERADFLKIGAEFGRAAEELLEQAPRERDEDDSDYFRSGDREVSVTDLFRDL